MGETYGGEDRRRQQRKSDVDMSALQELARRGAAIAIAENKVRLRVISGFVGCLMALAVMIPVAIVLKDDANTNAHDEAVSNCIAVADARPAGNARAFVEREVLHAADDFVRALPLKFQVLEIAKINRDLGSEQSRAPGILPKKITEGFGDLIKYVQDAPLINCRQLIGKTP